MELWIPVVVALVTSLGAFLGAVATSKNDVKKLKHKHELDLEALKEKHLLDMQTLERQQKHELDKMSTEIDSQAKLYEKNKQTDMISDLMGNPAMASVLQKMVMQEFAGSKKKR